MVCPNMLFKVPTLARAGGVYPAVMLLSSFISWVFSYPLMDTVGLSFFKVQELKNCVNFYLFQYFEAGTLQLNLILQPQ